MEKQAVGQGVVALLGKPAGWEDGGPVSQRNILPRFGCQFLLLYKEGEGCVCVCQSLSHLQLFVAPWTVTHQTLPSMEFSRQEYWSEQPFPSPGDLPDPGIEPVSPALQAGSLPSEPPGKPQKTISCCKYFQVPADSRGDVLMSSLLQPFTGGPGQNVSCELRYFSLTSLLRRQGPGKWTIMSTLSYMML